ncbi:hypothetical protein MSHRCOH1_01735 [Candidatus Ornithobacterium hominis]|nr:hypothetical protein MSHRCOH1_01735 [Candidatus Ornithobacterium hominis]
MYDLANIEQNFLRLRKFSRKKEKNQKIIKTDLNSQST